MYKNDIGDIKDILKDITVKFTHSYQGNADNAVFYTFELKTNNIELKTNNIEWFIDKRYSEFHALKENINKKKKPSSKTTLGTNEIDERHDTWLKRQKLLNKNFLQIRGGLI